MYHGQKKSVNSLKDNVTEYQKCCFKILDDSVKEDHLEIVIPNMSEVMDYDEYLKAAAKASADDPRMSTISRSPVRNRTLNSSVLASPPQRVRASTIDRSRSSLANLAQSKL